MKEVMAMKTKQTVGKNAQNVGSKAVDKKVVAKNDSSVDVEPCYIDETLKLIESEDVRKKFRAPERTLQEEDYAELIFKAPIPLEQKLPLLKLIMDQSRLDDDESRFEYDPAALIRQINATLKGRYNAPDGTVFRVIFRITESYTTMSEEQRIRHEWREKYCSTFDAAVEYIKHRKSNPDENGMYTKEEGSDCDDVYYIDKLLPLEYKSKVFLRWFLNSDGDILYFDYPAFDKSLNTENHSVLLSSCGYELPYKAGDIVIADCRPFADVKRVVVLDDDPYCLCMFINEDGNVDVGDLESNEFVRNPRKNYVHMLYRAKLYDGELTEAETPLGVVSNAVKANPELGYDIYKYVQRFRGQDELSRSFGLKHNGVLWPQLKKAFGV